MLHDVLESGAPNIFFARGDDWDDWEKPAMTIEGRILAIRKDKRRYSGEKFNTFKRNNGLNYRQKRAIVLQKFSSFLAYATALFNNKDHPSKQIDFIEIVEGANKLVHSLSKTKSKKEEENPMTDASNWFDVHTSREPGMTSASVVFVNIVDNTFGTRDRDGDIKLNKYWTKNNKSTYIFDGLGRVEGQRADPLFLEETKSSAQVALDKLRKEQKEEEKESGPTEIDLSDSKEDEEDKVEMRRTLEGLHARSLELKKSMKSLRCQDTRYGQKNWLRDPLTSMERVEFMRENGKNIMDPTSPEYIQLARLELDKWKVDVAEEIDEFEKEAMADKEYGKKLHYHRAFATNGWESTVSIYTDKKCRQVIQKGNDNGYFIEWCRTHKLPTRFLTMHFDPVLLEIC